MRVIPYGAYAKHLGTITIIVATCCLMALAASAQPTNHVFLPLVQQPPQSRLVTLVDTDAGFVAAELLPNTTRVFVIYIDRHDANRIHVTEHIGDRLVEIPDPMLAQLVFADVLSPSSSGFTFPGPKQGTGDPLIVGNELRIYVTSRDGGDPTGPFKVKVLTMPIPKPPTQ